MADLKIEWYCRNCEHTEVHDDLGTWLDTCPKCGSDDLFHSNLTTCACGNTVYTNQFTNICPDCGRLYNANGEELAPPEEWDDEERYQCFGPQNDNDDY